MNPLLSPKLPLASLTGMELSIVSKLLFNAWSAEFALRLKPVNADRNFLNDALTWAFPQAYCAALFSARAVLAVDDVRVTDTEVLQKLLGQWADGGLYGPGFTCEANPFTDLMQICHPSARASERMRGPQAAALHVTLTKQVQRVALIHETYILHRLGADAYWQLVDALPAYLKNGFVGERAVRLLDDG